jgi:hypothetical protein
MATRPTSTACHGHIDPTGFCHVACHELAMAQLTWRLEASFASALVETALGRRFDIVTQRFRRPDVGTSSGIRLHCAHLTKFVARRSSSRVRAVRLRCRQRPPHLATRPTPACWLVARSRITNRRRSLAHRAAALRRSPFLHPLATRLAPEPRPLRRHRPPHGTGGHPTHF